MGCNLTEGKSFSGRRAFATDKAILMSTLVRLIGSLRANLDKKMISRAISDYARLKEEFKDSLFGILESYQRGEITADVMETLWRAEIRDAWEKAYQCGVRSVGNPFGVWEEDNTWLKGAEIEEYGYLGKFVQDIQKNALVMGVEDRLGMYVETLDGVFHHGKVDGSPEFVKIHWDLHEAKHCDDCIRFAAGSPYTKKALPAVPRDGTSKCLAFCKCELRFEYAEQKPEPESYTIKGPKPMVPPAGYRLPSDKERDKLGQMSAEIDRLRGLISISTGDVKKDLIRQRRDLNAELIGYMEKHKVYYVPLGQVQRVKFVESLADDVGKALFEGGPGSGHWGHKGGPGFRGGSLASAISAHKGASSKVTVIGDRAEAGKVRGLFDSLPESHRRRSFLKEIVVLKTVGDVTKQYNGMSGHDLGGQLVDGFFHHGLGRLVVAEGSSAYVAVHEIAHSIKGVGMWKKMVWDANASTGKVTRYGKTDMNEAFAESYAMHVVNPSRLKRKAAGVAAVMDKLFGMK